MTVRTKIPKNFYEFSNGITYMTDGLRAPQRWDSLTSAPESAGVVGPTNVPKISGGGRGTITGDLYARVRFVDRLGFVSNVSDASAVFQPGTQRSFQTIQNTVPIIVDATGHGLQTGDIIYISGAVGLTAANGSWTVTSIDNDHYSLDSSAGNGEYRGGATIRGGVSQVTYSNLPVPTDSKVVRRQILRNKGGDANTFYIDLDTTDLAALSLSSTHTDDELTTSLAVPMFNSAGEDQALVRYSLPPDDKAVFVSHLGRMYAWVSVLYRDGNAVVTNGSKTVTGIGTAWTAEFVNRVFYSKGSSQFYTIVAVEESQQALTLDKAYAGPTDPYVQYGIRPSIERIGTAFYSDVGLPEAWPPNNAFPIQFDPEAGEETAAMPLSSFLFFFFEYRCWRLSAQFDPAKDGYAFRSHNRGCVNQRCWLIADGTAYVMDRGGIYSMSLNNMDPVSSSVSDIFRSGFSPYSINWKARDQFHAVHSPQEQVIRWFVALSGDDVPRHAIALAYRSGSITIESYSRPVGASCLGVLDGRPQTYLGLDARQIVASYLGTLDGPRAGSGTVRGNPTAAGHTWIEDSSATFPAAGVVGSPLVIAEGRGRGQVRQIAAVSGKRLTVVRPWTERPDETSVYQIGGIPWVWKSGWIRYPESDQEKPFHVEVIWKRTKLPSTMSLRLYHDQSAVPENWAQNRIASRNDSVGTTRGEPDIQILTDDEFGLVRQSIPQQREASARGRRHLAVELAGVTNADLMQVSQIGLEGVAR